MTFDPVLIGSSEDPFRFGMPVHIVPAARRRHLALFGASGAGKSSLMRNMIAEDILAGHGLTVVDPHGQLVEDILDNHIPRHRTNDVIYFNPKNRERAFALNLLDCRREEQRGLVVSNVISIFKKLWADSFGPRMEDILRNALHALVEQRRPVSILALPKLLTDKDYRSEVLADVRNPAVLDFLHNTYDKWDNRFREEAISPVLNKCRAFLTDPMIRAVIGQTRSSFDFREAMDNRKIILCDLSKGEIGADNATLLGSVIVMQEKLAALSRSDIRESERVDHFLFAEEAHNFIGDFESILAENRKFKLFLAICLQQLEAVSRETAAAIFTNAANPHRPPRFEHGRRAAPERIRHGVPRRRHPGPCRLQGIRPDAQMRRPRMPAGRAGTHRDLPPIPTNSERRMAELHRADQQRALHETARGGRNGDHEILSLSQGRMTSLEIDGFPTWNCMTGS
jgi:hypothetical protein